MLASLVVKRLPSAVYTVEIIEIRLKLAFFPVDQNDPTVISFKSPPYVSTSQPAGLSDPRRLSQEFPSSPSSN